MTRYYLQNDGRYYYRAAIRDAVRRGGGKHISYARQAVGIISSQVLTVVTWSAKGSAVDTIDSELRMLYPWVKQGHGLPVIKEKDW